MMYLLSVLMLLRMLGHTVSGNVTEKIIPHLVKPDPSEDMAPRHEAKTGNVSALLFGSKPPDGQCQKDLLYTWKNRLRPWARKMIDAFGKPETGIQLGNRFWFGDYESCREVYAPPHDLSPNGFQGQYCWLVWSYSGEFSKGVELISSGGCVPDSCSSGELYRSYSSLLEMINRDHPGSIDLMSTVSLVNVQVVTPTGPYPKSANFFWLTVCVIGIIIFLGTLLSLKTNATVSLDKDDKEKLPFTSYNNTEKRPGWMGFCTSFSLFNSFSSLTNTTSSPGEITCVHGMRFFSMTWVVMEHVFINSVSITGDLSRLIHDMDKLIPQIIVEGQYSVDTFFLISGFLHAYLLLKSKVAMTGSKFILMNVHRYLRISPPFFMVLFFCSTVLPYVSDGPFWSYMESITVKCPDYWWAHLLYISNLVDKADECLPWVWYLPNDMQFFFFGTILLLVIKRSPRHGFIILWFVQISLFIITFWVTCEGGYERTMTYIRELEVDIQLSQDHIKELSKALYSKPYSRAGPYLVGILFGYTYLNNSQRKVRISKVRSTTYWTLATAGALVSVFAMHLLPSNPFVYGLYHGASRSIWAAAVGWVVYACATGNAGPVDAFLSWKGFYPLSRLSYCAYLCHPIFVYWLYYGLKSPIKYGFLFYYIIDLGILLLSMIVALVLYLMIESPFTSLEKKLLKRSS